ncbi:porin family protein [Emticicia sp. 17c]|uniref:porin family protein n=1 Tax=Emticicia sp. 17c TaxID=3127704 RepID=UPI00301CF0F3
MKQLFSQGHTKNTFFWGFTSVLVFVSVLSSAQIRPLSQYGFKVGTGISKTSIIDNQTNIIPKFRNDFNVGLFYRRNINKFSVQPELYYQVRGGSFKASTNFAETGNLILRNYYRYVSVPLLFGYEVARNISVVAGPEYGVALNAGTSHGPYNNTDFNVVAGVRIDMLDIAHLFSINIRYVHGLSNTTNKTYTLADKSVIPLNFQNRTLQISATYNFSDYYNWWRKHGVSKKKK